MSGWACARHPIVWPWLVLGLLVAGSDRQATAGTERLAVADFDFIDSSNEPVDRSVVHAARIATFSRSLRDHLAGQGRFVVLRPACGQERCSAGAMPDGDLVRWARDHDARFLAFGGVQKASTLVQWARAEVVDLRTGRVVFQRLLSFRGDTDEAWRHAERFLARALADLPP
ncbi:DUF2380 domain-containing protein [Marinivivus vitaminiproducens]|uniref:DUF2380 domain-containing protein n=1 Tax=Marinivivus vitaminiproducens TaxID=3035935 RepID=UPI0027A89E29|nr:DUF2380 domain-containing protein [Geminicoccaceae bacterium SCSIO 64248]